MLNTKHCSYSWLQNKNPNSGIGGSKHGELGVGDTIVDVGGSWNKV